MFNFHKPRIYRSSEGCCICKAKSSSSRFTDSRKYERDTVMQCFDLKYPRQGEICNACVLLIKRYKRLPVGSKRNWSHIVDAKAGIGPGYNKIQTKFKSERINSKAAAQQQQQEHDSASSCANNKNIIGNGAVVAAALNGMCFMPEKFSKIFKKSKKSKDGISSYTSKRKIANNGWSQNNTNSSPNTPESLDSDYEDTRLHALSGNPGSSTVVQFQTQTRASAYKAQAAAEAKKKILKLGTKRRKCLTPRKYYRSKIYEESLKFFDEDEWVERKSCCGTMYECASLAGAVLLDIDNYNPCEQHQQRRLTTSRQEEKSEHFAANITSNDRKNTTALSLPKSIIQTTPVVVQLQPPQRPLPSSFSVPSFSTSSINNNNSLKTATTTTTTPTPVLKKHHLFYKRQSECFPQGDMVATTNIKNNTNNTNSNTAYEATNIKTEFENHQNQLYHKQQQQPYQQHQQSNPTTLQRRIENAAIHSNSSANPPTTMLTSSNSLASSALSISVTSLTSSSAAMPQMPKHSLAKVTTISPPLTSSLQHNNHHHHITSSSNSSILPLSKPNSFLHKIKTDFGNGKIVKHSLEKFNTGIRLKTSDISDIKPLIRTVDKTYLLSKPPPTQAANILSLNATTTATTTSSYQSLASYNIVTAQQPPLITASLSVASPTSSTSSTSSSTKFSDNSSDSGFDENMLDRKSASPLLQEDCEKKITSRAGVQTMFLASGVQIQSQPQNVILTGNDVAAKILQNRKYNTITTTPITTNTRSLTVNHHPATSGIKVAQITSNPLTSSSSSSSGSSTVGPPISMSSAAQAKMRAIYNNNNTIQHENGVTTIVPASSLAATTQTAAMQNIAPSTVTITPAPPLGTQFNTQNVISRKLTTANIINLQSNTTNLGNSHNNTSGNYHQNHHLSTIINNNNHNNATNQKIILLKTPNPSAVTANYNTLIGGGVGKLNSS